MKKTVRFSMAGTVLVTVLLSTGCEEKRANTTPPPQAQVPERTQVAQAQPAPQPQTPAPVQPQAPKPDPVDALLKRVQKEYETGQNNYKAGHLDAARDNFDKAVGMLMQGPADVRSDARLQAEFDRITEGVRQLEMAALKEGDGFTAQKAEPAPIDEINEMTFPVDPAVKAKAEAELRTTRSDIPLVMNDYVASYINFFTNTTKGRNTLLLGWQRAGRYREMILRIMEEEGVPKDLIYLAQAESGFRPLAVSRVGARGMWQFMHYTSPAYGLKRSWWVDERQDPELATRAAARHLRDLYNQFGDWHLAMAAYNSGAGNVQRGVQRTGYADFWELYKRNVLPNETKNYVPIILAMTIIAKNPSAYGLSEAPVELPVEIDTVDTDYAVDLRLVAEIIERPLDELKELNPGLLRMVTPKDAEYKLRLPGGTAEKFQQVMASIPKDKRVAWRYHRVSSGDTLASLAKKYRTTSQAIIEVNNLTADDLEPESKLVIPVNGRSAGEGRSLYAKTATRYTVRRGDTVLTVADDFGVPAEKVRQWNRLKGNDLRPGRKLSIYKPVGEDYAAAPDPPAKRSKGKTTKAANGSTTHKVKKGDTLSSIASRYNTTVDSLKQANGLTSSSLRAGAVLVVR